MDVILMAKLTKKEMKNAMKFETKSVLRAYDHKQTQDFLNALPTDEERRECFEDKQITIKPLSDKEIKDLAMELLENGYNGETVFGITINEKLDVIRNNRELINDYIESENYEDRLFLDSPSTTSELKWSSSKAWEVVKRHLDIDIP